MIPTSASFKALQSKTAAEVRLKLLGILRNVAHRGEGSGASAIDSFSADFPAAGVIDGDATTLNYGPSGPADDGIGLAGWKSASAAASLTRSTAAEWNAGVQSGVQTIGNWAQLSLPTSYYQQNFNALALGSLTPQDGWVQVSGAGLIDVSATTPAGMDGQTIRLQASAARIIRHTLGAVPSKALWAFQLYRDVLGGGAQNRFLRLTLRDSTAAINRFSIKLTAEAGPLLLAGVTGAETRVDLLTNEKFQVTEDFVVDWDHAGSPTTARVKIAIDGIEVFSRAIDMTGVDTVELELAAAAGADSVWYMNNFRIGAAFSSSGTQDVVLDWGASGPVASSRALLTNVGLAQRQERMLISTPANRLHLTPVAAAIRQVTTRTKYLHSFVADSSGTANAIYLLLRRVGGPPVGNVWAEIRDEKMAVPGTGLIRLATSRPVPADSLTTTFAVYRLDFPRPYYMMAGKSYAIWIGGDFAIGATYVEIGGVAGGTRYFGDNVLGQEGDPEPGSPTTYTAEGSSILFAIASYWEPYEGDIQPTGLTAVAIRATSQFSPALELLTSQAYTPANTHDAVGIRLKPSLPAGTAPLDSWWVEIYEDDGAGNPKPTRLAATMKYPTLHIFSTHPDVRPFDLAFQSPFRFQAGKTYHIIPTANYPVKGHTIPNLYIFNEGSITGSILPGLLHWQMDTGTWASFVSLGWIKTTMSFSILTEHRPSIRYEVATSADNITYSAFNRFVDNPTLAGSLTAELGFGGRFRYWKVRAKFLGSPNFGVGQAWPDRPATPTLKSLTIKAVFRTAKHVTVDFGQLRTISRVEAFAHAVEHGFRTVKFQGATVAVPTDPDFTDLTGWDAKSAGARRSGGGATISFSGPEITITGDALEASLSQDVSIRHLRMVILDNDDEFARVMEVTAQRVIDWSDRIVGDPTIAGNSDFLFRRMKARTFNVTLQNTDGALSLYRTDIVGGYNDQLGVNVRLLMFSGYADAADLIRHGTFYVDNWSEDPQSSLVRVSTRDRAGVMSEAVAVNYKSNIRADRAIEYLANLAGIPSTDLALDPVLNTIGHFAPTNPNAYEEAQKIAEAAGFGALYFDRDGYLIFKGNGNTLRSLGLETSGLLTGSQIVSSNVVTFKGKTYVIRRDSSTSPDSQALAEYDPATGLWTIKFTIPTDTLVSGGLEFRAALLSSTPDRLFIAVASAAETITSWAGGGVAPTVVLTMNGGQLYEWDGVTFAPSYVRRIFAPLHRNTGIEGRVWATSSFVEDGLRWFLIGQGDLVGLYDHTRPLWELDLVTLQPSPYAVEYRYFRRNAGNKVIDYGFGIPVTQTEVWGPEWPGLQRYYGAFFDPVGGLHHIQGFDIGGEYVTPFSITGNEWLGLGSTGDGRFYAPFGNFFESSTNLFRIIEFNVLTGVVDGGSQYIHPTLAIRGGSSDATVWQDGYLIAGANTNPANVAPSPLITDFKWGTLDESVQGANRSLIMLDVPFVGNSNMRYFRTETRADGLYILGLADAGRVFEFRVRRKLATQASAVFTLDGDATSGLLGGLTLDGGDERAGKSRMVNLVFVKSSPLVAYPVEKVWEASNLPWVVRSGQRLEFRIEIREPALTLVPSITTSPGGLAAVTVSSQASQPKIIITFSGDCQVTAFSISGAPLKKGSTLISVAVGSERSFARYGPKQFEHKNDYIYEMNTLSAISGWIIARFGDRKVAAKASAVVAVTDVESFDRGKLVDPRVGLNGDFYVIEYLHRLRSQRSDLGLIEV